MSLGNPVVDTESQGRVEPEMPHQADQISICHIASGDRWAGAEVQVAAMLKTLALKKQFHLCAILLNNGRLADQLCACGIKVKVYSESQHNFLQVFSKATLFLKDEGVRILHSHRNKENLLAALLSRRCRIPFVVRSEHGLPEPFGGSRAYKRFILQLLDKMVARYATDLVISVSGDLRSHLASYVQPSKLVTIYNGIDKTQVHSNLSKEEAKARLGIRNDCWVIGTAGRLDPIKRLDIFLEVARQIGSGVHNARFVIAGEGSERDHLHKLIRSQNLQEQVLLLPHQNEIHDVLRAFDVFILCSDHEGLPMVLLEVLWLGIPVVSRQVGGVPEVIQDGVNGILIKSADPSVIARASIELLFEPELARRLASAGKRVVADRFTAEDTAEQVAKLYLSLKVA